MMKQNRLERGQTIIFIALAMVAMVGFIGLAVDGGHVYSERRRAQNAADAAAYAAASAAVDGLDYVKAALAQAGLNSFTDGDEHANPNSEVDVIVHHPPTQGEFVGNSEYYEVVVRVDVESTFAKAIAFDNFPVEVYAVARAQPTATLSGDNVIHALNDEDIGIYFKGNVSVNVNGGNIFSNSAIAKKGTVGDIKVTGGSIYYTTPDGWMGNKQGVSPAPEQAAAPVYVSSITTPSCGSAVGYLSGTTFHPGTYSSKIQINGNGDYTFEKGIYCLQDGIKINGNASVYGRDVLFVLEDGDFGLNGTSASQLYRASNITDANGNQYGGLLLYVPPSNSDSVVSLLGTNGTSYAGTVLNPEGICEVGGTADLLGLRANIICWQIAIHGNPSVTVDYKAAQNLQLPPSLELSE